MKPALPPEVMKRSRLVGGITSIVMLLLLGALLIPNMESGLVLLTIFGVSGVAGALSSGIVRYKAQRKAFELDRTLPKPTPALTALVWGSMVLSVYAALVILNTWFLTPGDPAPATAENIHTKLKTMVGFGLALVGLISLARWSFRKRFEVRNASRHDIPD
jgi:hypothetical protein